jgi:hypothetical protein
MPKNAIKIEFSKNANDYFYAMFIKNNQILCNVKILKNNDKNYYTILKNRILKNRNLIMLCKLIKNELY